ncbi:MAG: protease inhibitor I42 family protein [Dehalococcoidales bacterium]|nr:protease inhibitor I42 family protein [Dehalococcoidales bacterium]
MRKALPLIMGILLTTCLVAGGCGMEVKAYTDPQDEISINTDGEFAILIALDSNPTTGYSWQASYDETMLELVEETYELGEFAGQGLLGAGGTELFRFKALKKGEVEITMVYKRPWEEEILQQKVFIVEVK